MAKLKPLVRALKDADKLVHEANEWLEHKNWDLELLLRPSDTARTSPDSLDQLIACAQTLTEDVRQTASFIQGNATLLFKRAGCSLATPTTPNNPQASGDWLEDCDYVSLESKETSAQKNADLRDTLHPDLRPNFDQAVKQAETGPLANVGLVLDQNDRALLEYYAQQVVTHIQYLGQAIDGLLLAVEHNQPPKHFLAHGKFVVLSTHNLVNIGDIVHRNVTQKTVKAKVLERANALNDGMKECVNKTKRAAQHFPSVTAVQQMVDTVMDISQLAKELKLIMLEAVRHGSIE